MANKKKLKQKPELVMVGIMVPRAVSDALKLLAQNERRSVSNVGRKVLEESPDVQAVLREIQAA